MAIVSIFVVLNGVVSTPSSYSTGNSVNQINLLSRQAFSIYHIIVQS